MSIIYLLIYYWFVIVCLLTNFLYADLVFFLLLISISYRLSNVVRKNVVLKCFLYYFFYILNGVIVKPSKHQIRIFKGRIINKNTFFHRKSIKRHFKKLSRKEQRKIETRSKFLLFWNNTDNIFLSRSLDIVPRSWSLTGFFFS